MAKEKEEAVEASEEENTEQSEQAQAEAQAEAPAAEPEAAPAAPAAPPQQPVQVQVDDAGVKCSYSNFCRVSGSPEELIVDFALNPQPMGVPNNPIKIDERIVMNFYTAKRLLAALQMSIQRHEAVFGVLETNIQKRINPQQQG